jgi:thioredoxin reductase
MSTTTPSEVVVVGGGVAGLSAAVFTARHGLDTLVVDAGESILRRNAHLENFPRLPRRRQRPTAARPA